MKYKLELSKTPKISRFFLIGIISLIFFGGGSYLLGWSDIFSLRSIAITGAPTAASKNAVSAALQITSGEKLARLDPRGIQNRLRSFDWIESADVSRNWLTGNLAIELNPRIPIAIYSQLGKPQLLVDASGKSFLTPIEIPADLPRILAATSEAGFAAVNLYMALPKEFAANLLLLTANRVDSFELESKIVGRNIQIIWGENNELDLKIEVIEELLKLPENRSIKNIDVSAPRAPVVR